MPYTKTGAIEDIAFWIKSITNTKKKEVNAYDIAGAVSNIGTIFKQYVKGTKNDESKQEKMLTKDDVLSILSTIPIETIENKLQTLKYSDITVNIILVNIHEVINFLPEDNVYKPWFLKLLDTIIAMLKTHIVEDNNKIQEIDGELRIYKAFPIYPAFFIQNICEHLTPACQEDTDKLNDVYTILETIILDMKEVFSAANEDKLLYRQFCNKINSMEFITSINKLKNFISEKYPSKSDDFITKADELIKLAQDYYIKQSEEEPAINWVQNILSKRKPILNPSERDLI